jgi:hypothetical protein
MSMLVWQGDVNGMAEKYQYRCGGEMPVLVSQGDLKKAGVAESLKNAGVAGRFQFWCGREMSTLVWQGNINADVARGCQCWFGWEKSMLVWQGYINAGEAGRCQKKLAWQRDLNRCGAENANARVAWRYANVYAPTRYQCWC